MALEARLRALDPMLDAGNAGYLGVPLAGPEGAPLGVLAVYTREPRPWRGEEIEAMLEGVNLRDCFRVIVAAEDVTVGKPDPQLFLTALDRLGDGRALVVGDRLDTDLKGAAAAGLDAAIVLTGAAQRREAEAAKDPAPVAVADTLAALVLDGAAA